MGFAGQDSGAVCLVLPEVAVVGFDGFVRDRRHGGEFGLLGDRFVLGRGGGVLGDFCDWLLNAELYAGGVFHGDVESADDQGRAFRCHKKKTNMG